MPHGDLWTREEHEILLYDNEDGVSRRVTAAKLDRTEAAVRTWAKDHGITYPARIAEAAALREHWKTLLPKLKADLRHDIEHNI